MKHETYSDWHGRLNSDWHERLKKLGWQQIVDDDWNYCWARHPGSLYIGVRVGETDFWNLIANSGRRVFEVPINQLHGWRFKRLDPPEEMFT